MQLAGYTYSFASLLDRGEIDTADILHFYGELGVTGVEIMAGYIHPGEIPVIEKALFDTGMSVACYDVVCDVNSSDPAHREARRMQLEEDLRQAARLGAKTVLVIPGFPPPELEHETVRQWFAEALRDSLPLAARLGITLTVANVGWQPVVYGKSDQIIEICATAGAQLKVTYDVGNFLLAGEENLQALTRVAPRMVHVHFKDWKIVSERRPSAFPGADGLLYEGEILGRGILDLPAAVRKLRHVGYRGWISVEYEGTGEPLEAARGGVAYLRDLLEKSPRSGA